MMGSFLYPKMLMNVAMHVSPMVISVPSQPAAEKRWSVLSSRLHSDPRATYL